MRQFHKNPTDFQITKVGHKAITTAKNDLEQIAEFVKPDQIAITEIKVFYPPGFEEIPVYIKKTGGNKEFFICDGLPLSVIGNKFGDVRSKERTIISAETLEQCLLVHKDIKLEIHTRPKIVLPENTLLFVISNYKYIG